MSQNGSNVHLKTQPENKNGSKIHMRTQPQKNDEVSLNALKLWFGNNADSPLDHQRVNGDSKTADPQDNQPALLNDE